jgi:hypothetical protein
LDAAQSADRERDAEAAKRGGEGNHSRPSQNFTAPQTA